MEGEQFSLCWNNFHNNLSSGFHSLLQDEALVDVTLAADGRYLKAHKAVLSVCSPYFKELFRVNPCKHPIVILQDVKYSALNNLLQFMYQGEVSVSQEEIPMFMKVAETLKVKGLTESSGDKNGIENSTLKNNSQPPYSSTPEPKPQLMRRRPMRKLIKPIQHLRPLETTPSHSPPPLASPQPPPLKKPHIEEKPPEASVEPPQMQMPVNPKQEPVELPQEEAREPSYDERMEMSSTMEGSVGGEPSPSHFSMAWKPPDAKMPPDASSPEGTEEIIIINPDSDNDIEDILNDHEYIVFNRRQPKGQRWSAEDTNTLIEAYEKFKINFSIVKRRKQVWKAIEEYLASKGVNYPGQSAYIKWRNLIRTYNIVRDNKMQNKHTRFPFYDKMKQVLGDNAIPPLIWGDKIPNSEQPKKSVEAKVKKIEQYENADAFEEKDDLNDTKGQRWSIEDTYALIDAYVMFQDKFKAASFKQEVWDMIEEHLEKNGISYPGQNVQHKWRNLLRTYRIIQDNKLHNNNRKRFPFYDKLAQVLGDQPVSNSEDCLEEPRENIEETNENIEETIENIEETIENIEEISDSIEKKDIEHPNLCKGQRWSEDDTNALIDAYEKFRINFSIAKRRSQVWKMIEDYLESNGVSYPGQNVQHKWRNLIRTYRIVQESKTHSKRTRFPFYEKLTKVLGSDESVPPLLWYNVSSE